MDQEENPNISPEENLEDTRPRKALPPRDEPEPQPGGAETFSAPAPEATDEPESPASDTSETRAVLPASPAGGFSETLPPPDDFTRPAPLKRPAGARPASKAGGKPVKKVVKKRRSARWLLWPAVGLLLLILIAAISAFAGYGSGINLRRAAASTQSAASAADQFQRGLDDMAQGNYYRARQRFEYVIQLDPTYPGATEKLAEAIMYVSATATPTVAATPTLTPTPDTRAVDDLWNQAQTAMSSKDWSAAIDALLALRSKDINYRVIEVDDLLFVALRNRGYDKITKADLESGIYDLTLASNFGPLDAEADGLVTWSQMYITGASFWGIDWSQVIDYFSQVAPQMPYLMDGSGMTATERLRQAYFEYGNQLAGQGEFCKAVEMYQQSLAISPMPEVEAALNSAAGPCGGGGQEAPAETQKPPKKTKTP